ncbi:MAG TPA: protein kinase [Thermomonospora sp.]|nr:protein kinase [Thermomonospora sp.]
MDNRHTRPHGESAQPLGPGDPAVIGPYRLESRLGEGGMGAVYLGRRDDGPPVAVKVVRAELADDPAFLARFQDEVANARRVASFCTAQVLDHGREDGRAYMVTEYIEGPSLLQHVAEHGALSPGMLNGVAVGVAAALLAIHSAGLVHRDLKPGNVLLSISGPRVIDFGIARALDVATGHTRTGQVIGSPGWIAPEQILNHPVTPAVDVFAWGCLVAYAGTGRHPFGTGTFQIMAARVVHADPDVGPLPDPLAGLVRRALDKDPARRPTAQELLLSLVGGGGEAAVTTSLTRAWPTDPDDATTLDPSTSLPSRTPGGSPSGIDTPSAGPGRDAASGDSSASFASSAPDGPAGPSSGENEPSGAPDSPPGRPSETAGSTEPSRQRGAFAVPGVPSPSGEGGGFPGPGVTPGGSSPSGEGGASTGPGVPSDGAPSTGGSAGQGGPSAVSGAPGSAAPGVPGVPLGGVPPAEESAGAGGFYVASGGPAGGSASGTAGGPAAGAFRGGGASAGSASAGAPTVPVAGEAGASEGRPGEYVPWGGASAVPETRELGRRGRDARRGGKGRTRGVVATVAGVALLTVGVTLAAYALRDRDRNVGGDAAAGPPGHPILVRIDQEAGWPKECRARIGRLTPGNGVARASEILRGEGCDVLPQWSPDRSMIAFTRWGGGATSDVWVAGADGGGARRVVEGISGRGRVAWSPDGRRLAVMIKVDGVAQLHLAEVATGQTRQITHDDAGKDDPAWSREGKIAFWSRRDGVQQVFCLDPDEPDQEWTRLTTPEIAPGGANDPAWSPDGDRLAFTLMNGEGRTNDIAVVDADGSDHRRLTTDPAHDMDPSWSPDGEWLAFVRGPVETPQIWAMPVDQGESGARAVGPSAVGHPAWS